MRGKFLIDLTDAPFGVVGNEDVLEFVRRSTRASDGRARLQRWCAQAFADATAQT